ncbi:MAG: hypothetical protein JNN18_06170 [Rubrivivax sp.]|jgi:hypothetical protein|nr:hypothetical protein [Rubrivivax sp.]
MAKTVPQRRACRSEHQDKVSGSFLRSVARERSMAATTKARAAVGDLCEFKVMAVSADNPG